MPVTETQGHLWGEPSCLDRCNRRSCKKNSTTEIQKVIIMKRTMMTIMTMMMLSKAMCSKVKLLLLNANYPTTNTTPTPRPYQQGTNQQYDHQLNTRL